MGQSEKIVSDIVEWVLRMAARAKRLDDVELLINHVARKLIKSCDKDGEMHDQNARRETQKGSIAYVFELAKCHPNATSDSPLLPALDRIIRDLDIDRVRPVRKKKQRDQGSWRRAWLAYLWCFGK
jgi:hypothetical protein